MAIDIKKLSSRDYSETTLTGKISRVFRSTERWSAGRLWTEDGSMLDRECSFSVTGQVEENQTVTLHGAWVNDAKYGWQFKADTIEYPAPDTTSIPGLAHHIQNMDGSDGIGPVKAQKIAEAFAGEDFDRIIREEPERIAEAAKVKLEQALSLQATWMEQADINAISIWLAGYGLTANQIKKIAKKYGNQARQVLTENPYRLMDDIDGFGFLKTDQIALKMGVDKLHQGRIRACIIHTLDEAASNAGHTYIDEKQLAKATNINLNFDTTDGKQAVEDTLEAMFTEKDPPIIREEVEDKTYIGLKWLHFQELELLQWFKLYANEPALLNKAASTDIDALIKAEIKANNLRLEEAQEAAIRQTLTNRISVLTGGAGTGKSFIIKTIRAIYESLDRKTAVCAPTGKAARRLANDGIPATTIHRLLEYSPIDGGFIYSKDNKLPVSVVIIDETSMCAVPLLYSLLSAIDLNTTTVLFVGDQNQLPPIGPGNVLRDSIEHNLLPCTRLTVCHRNAGKLKENCAEILNGRLNRKASKVPNSDTQFDWFVVSDRENPEYVVDLLKLMMEEQFDVWRFDPISECQIIAPQRKGVLGCNRLNVELQRVWQNKRYNRNLPPISNINYERRAKLYPGDKIMQIKNDYNLDPVNGGVMNGTQGVIKDIVCKPGSSSSSEQLYVIQFEDRSNTVEVEVGSEQAENVVLAYACTVHKVQGSQYPCVVSIVHRLHAFMLSRNLLYTAATRARTSSIIIGEPVGINRAIRTVTPMQRNTWMALLAGGGIDGQENQSQ